MPLRITSISIVEVEVGLVIISMGIAGVILSRRGRKPIHSILQMERLLIKNIWYSEVRILLPATILYFIDTTNIWQVNNWFGQNRPVLRIWILSFGLVPLLQQNCFGLELVEMFKVLYRDYMTLRIGLCREASKLFHCNLNGVLWGLGLVTLMRKLGSLDSCSLSIRLFFCVCYLRLLTIVCRRAYHCSLDWGCYPNVHGGRFYEGLLEKHRTRRHRRKGKSEIQLEAYGVWRRI